MAGRVRRFQGWLTTPSNPLGVLSDSHRVIALDLRNAKGCPSKGSLEIGRSRDGFTDDKLGLMDHLGIDGFMLLGFCIGGPIIWNLLKRADDRVFSAVPVHPSRYNTSLPDFYHQNDIKRWAPRLCKERPDITMDMASDY